MPDLKRFPRALPWAVVRTPLWGFKLMHCKKSWYLSLRMPTSAKSQKIIGIARKSV
jgi:hypothetical protein